MKSPSYIGTQQSPPYFLYIHNNAYAIRIFNFHCVLPLIVTIIVYSLNRVTMINDGNSDRDNN